MTNEQTIPPPADGDHEDVHWALSTAASLYASGARDEALKWLRRAVAAAIASDDDERAIALGRRAAEIEESLWGASTQPRDRADDLDAPTYADGHLFAEHTDSGTYAAHQASEALDAGSRDTDPGEAPAIDEEVTHTPFTKKADEQPAVRRQQLTEETLQAGSIPSESTGSAPKPAVLDSPADGRAVPPDGPRGDRATEPDLLGRFEPGGASVRSDDVTVASSTQPAVRRWRVALVAAADDDQPRVLPLSSGARAPAGAAVAFIFPASDADARVIASMLEGEQD